MGLIERVRGVIDRFTGGVAKVQFLFGPPVMFPGEEVQLGLSAASAGQEVRSKGVFVDLSATELVDFKDGSGNHIRYQEQTFYREIQVAPAFTLAPGEARQFHVALVVPVEARPSFSGKLSKNQWQLRGRIDVLGSDPDTGWIDVRIGSKQ